MNSIENYNILFDCGGNKSAIITKLPEQLDKRDVNRGGLLAGNLNGKLALRFSNNYPEYVKLYDFVENTLNFLIVSERAKTVFEAEGVQGLEYLPVQIFDHRGNLAGDNYYLINFLVPQPIIDMKCSGLIMSSIDGSIENIKNLRLNLDGVDPEAKLFRATTERYTNFITDDLIQAMNAAGITGIKTVPAEGWDGNTLSFI